MLQDIKFNELSEENLQTINGGFWKEAGELGGKVLHFLDLDTQEGADRFDRLVNRM